MSEWHAAGDSVPRTFHSRRSVRGSACVNDPVVPLSHSRSAAITLREFGLQHNFRAAH